MESRKNDVDLATQFGTSLLEGLASIGQQTAEDGSALALKAADYGAALESLSHSARLRSHVARHQTKQMRKVK